MWALVALAPQALAELKAALLVQIVFTLPEADLVAEQLLLVTVAPVVLVVVLRLLMVAVREPQAKDLTVEKVDLETVVAVAVQVALA